MPLAIAVPGLISTASPKTPALALFGRRKFREPLMAGMGWKADIDAYQLKAAAV